MKKILCLLFVLIMTMAFTGCGLEIADENGPDDSSLVSVTDDDIVDMEIGFSSYDHSPPDDTPEYMNEPTNFESSQFSGVIEVYNRDLDVDSVKIILGSHNLSSGNLCVSVLLDNEIIYKFNNEEYNQEFSLDNVEGNMSIRIAGESADFSTNLVVEYNGIPWNL